MRAALRLVVLVGLASGVARADTAPWAVGLTPEREAAAKVALDEGNRRFLENDYVGALARYREAIESWDHPAIRFNIVRCLIQLDRALEAEENLTLALKYGSAPLEPIVYNEALSYQKLLAKQVGRIEIGCTQPGVQLALDGKVLATCPATESRRVEPGQHQVVATKPGFMPKTVELFVTGGKLERATISLEPIGKTGRVVHRWRTWVPWTVFGGGLAVVGIGGLIQLKAASDMDRFDAQGTRCAVDGCTSGDLDYGLESSAKLENRVAIGVMSIGAATAIAGGVMLYLNRAQYVEDSAESRRRVVVVPAPGGGFVGVAGSF